MLLATLLLLAAPQADAEEPDDARAALSEALQQPSEAAPEAEVPN